VEPLAFAKECDMEDQVISRFIPKVVCTCDNVSTTVYSGSK